jgi:hypothetical protein
MRSRLFVTAGVFAVVLASPLAAQGGGMAGMNMDPTNKIVGSGKLPAGWELRWDTGTPSMTEVDVQKVGTSMHFRSGPAAIYYDPKDVAKGDYTVSATFSQAKSMGHEGYGLFIGGANLQDSTQHYIYFIVKPCRSHDPCSGEAAKTGTPLGEILISQRTSNAKPTALVATAHDDAVNTDAPGSGAATNVLAIRVAKDSLHFYANGKEVRTFAKSAFNGAPTDGIAGLRVNHNLDITVEGFAMKK